MRGHIKDTFFSLKKHLSVLNTVLFLGSVFKQKMEGLTFDSLNDAFASYGSFPRYLGRFSSDRNTPWHLSRSRCSHGVQPRDRGFLCFASAERSWSLSDQWIFWNDWQSPLVTIFRVPFTLYTHNSWSRFGRLSSKGHLFIAGFIPSGFIPSSRDLKFVEFFVRGCLSHLPNFTFFFNPSRRFTSCLARALGERAK